MYGIPIKFITAGLAAIGVVLGIYFYGHHQGTLAGRLEVATLTKRIAEDNAAFERSVRALEARNAQEVAKEKDALSAQLQKQAVAATKLQSTINGLRQQSNSYVAQIERLSGQDCGPSNSALSLAYRQYNELADALRETSTRADSAAAIANTLNEYAKIQ